jgi:hypothetical protein
MQKAHTKMLWFGQRNLQRKKERKKESHHKSCTEKPGRDAPAAAHDHRMEPYNLPLDGTGA